jgi:hypothetical protein
MKMRPSGGSKIRSAIEEKIEEKPELEKGLECDISDHEAVDKRSVSFVRTTL